jgi:hypothetical protein
MFKVFKPVKVIDTENYRSPGTQGSQKEYGMDRAEAVDVS